jgi:hypothetical protein
MKALLSGLFERIFREEKVSGANKEIPRFVFTILAIIFGSLWFVNHTLVRQILVGVATRFLGDGSITSFQGF